MSFLTVSVSSAPPGGIAHVDPAALTGLPAVIGQDRFQKYVSKCRGEHTQALRLYSWNVEASAAFLGAFAALEVGLRNALHRELSALASSPSWWMKLEFTGGDDRLINAAVEDLNQRKRVTWTPGHVVAELSFGFWMGLLGNRNHKRFWTAGLFRAFPHYPTTQRRDYLHESFERLRLLRNRAAHHEPIHARDLMVDHALMCELAGYIDSDLQTWIRTHTRLPAVVMGRTRTLTAARPTRF